jgi:hypothetical protein
MTPKKMEYPEYKGGSMASPSSNGASVLLMPSAPTT